MAKVNCSDSTVMNYSVQELWSVQGLNIMPPCIKNGCCEQ